MTVVALREILVALSKIPEALRELLVAISLPHLPIRISGGGEDSTGDRYTKERLREEVPTSA